MRLNSKGQVTIPAELRRKHHLHKGDGIEVIEDGNTLRIVRVAGGQTRGRRLVTAMRGRATTASGLTSSATGGLEYLRDRLGKRFVAGLVLNLGSQAQRIVCHEGSLRDVERPEGVLHGIPAPVLRSNTELGAARLVWFR